ncbi:MAG: amidohydrolase [Acidobacteriota bacterium]|nr:amidohydrolase [Acidobacteriota bacterium]
MARTFTERVPELVGRANDAMVELRHDLHAHPELPFDEVRTTSVIRGRLDELGWSLERCPTETGAVAVLSGGRPGRRVMLRADIDALPVTEERDLDYRSTVDGVMHACGHDVHAAALLGVADVLASRRDELAGEFVVVFQPAEEALGGARAMITGGLLELQPADAVLGVHVTSLAPVGFVGSRPGIFMSEATSLFIEILGRGGHGAMAARDGNVVLAASALAPRVAEVVDGLDFDGTGCACSIGVLRAGTKNNVVPRRAVLEGTLRTFTSEQRSVALSRLESLLLEVATRFSVSVTLSPHEGVPAVVNDVSTVGRVLDVARALLGEGNVLTVPPVTPSDDVSEFFERIPGCYLFVGGALADGTSGPHHSPDFAVDDAALGVIASVLSAAAVDLAQG